MSLDKEWVWSMKSSRVLAFAVTWLSGPIPEDRPSGEELFGEFYNSAIFDIAGAAR
jgi:hypothetical protein